METALFKHLHSPKVLNHTTLFALKKKLGYSGKNAYLVFVPNSWHRVFKTPGISGMVRVFWYDNEMTLGWGAQSRKPKSLKDWTDQLHPQMGGTGAEDRVQTAMVQDLLNHPCMKKPSCPEHTGSELNRWTIYGCVPKTAWKPHASLIPHLALCISSIWQFPSCFPKFCGWNY